MTPDCNRILEYMKTHGSITGIEATQELNIMDYRKRISEIIGAGIGINKVWKTYVNADGKKSRFREYSLEATA